MSQRKAITEYRDVTVGFSGAAPIDAYKGAMEKVAVIEGQYDKDAASVSDLTTERVLLTGTSPNDLYAFDVTLVKATGTYTFAYVGKAATAEEAVAL
jgi:hypothetical protein